MKKQFFILQLTIFFLAIVQGYGQEQVSIQNQTSALYFLKNHPLKDKVGAFEGAGYVSKGLYRPMLNCLMLKFDKDKPGLCKVCEDAVLKVIEYYSE